MIKDNQVKLFGILLAISLITGCGANSSDNPQDDFAGDAENELIGIWISNCYDFTYEDGLQVKTAYAKNLFTFESENYTDSVIEYSDASCRSTNGNTSEDFGTYQIGEEVSSTDGTYIKRITFNRDSSDYPEVDGPIVIEGVFRISGGELDFGSYLNGEAPSLLGYLLYTRK